MHPKNVCFISKDLGRKFAKLFSLQFVLFFGKILLHSSQQKQIESLGSSVF